MPAFTLAAPPHPTSGGTSDATVIWLYFNEKWLFMCAFLHVFIRGVYVVLCADILASHTRWAGVFSLTDFWFRYAFWFRPAISRVSCFRGSCSR